MADEIARPKITIVVDKDQAVAALRDLKTAGSDSAKALEQSLGAALDSSSKRIKRLTDEITGGGATRKLQDLEKAFHAAGGAAAFTGPKLDNLVSRIKSLEAAGGSVPASMKNLGASVSGLANNIEGQLNPALAGMAGRLGPLGSLLGSLGPVGVAAAAGVAALGLATGALASTLISSAQAALTYADRFADLAVKNDIGATALQHFALSAELVGANVETLTGTLFKLDSALEKAPEKFNDLGLSVERLRALAPEDRILEVVAALERMEDPVARNAAAMELLGKRWGEVRAIARGLKEGLGELADSLGITMADDVVESYGRLNDKLEILTKTWEGFWRNVGVAISQSPTIVAAIDTMTQALGDMSAALRDEGFAGFGKKLAGLAGGVSNEWIKGTIRAGTSGPMSMVEDFFGINLGSQALDSQLNKWLPTNISLGKGRSVAQQFVGPPIDEAEMVRREQEQRAHDARMERQAKERAAKARREREEIERIDKRNREQFGTDVGPFLHEAGPRPADPDQLNTGISLNQLAQIEIPGYREYKVRMSELAQAQPVFDKTKEKATDFVDILSAGADIAKLLGINMEGSLGNVVGSLTVASAAGLQFKDALKFHDSGGLDVMGTLKGPKALDTFMGLASGFGSMLNATGAGKSTRQNLFGGASSGASLGSAFGLQGAGVGAVAGLQFGMGRDENIRKRLGKGGTIAASLLQPAFGLGALSSAFSSESDKIAADVGRDFGVKISKELADTIKAEGKGRFDGALKHLGAIIGEAGGIKSFGVDNAIAKTRDLFSAMERGTLTVDEVGAAFDDVFGDIAANAIDKTTGRLQDNARELLRLAQTRGVKSEAMDAFIVDQGTKASAGLQAFLDNAKVSSQGAATAIGSSIAAIYDQLIVSGVSRFDALKQLEPTIASLRTQLEATGFNGGAAFAALDAQIALVNDKVHGPMVQGILGLGQAMTSLHNMNLLTAADFQALSGEVTNTFNAMVAGGASAPAAMAAVQPVLQQVWEMQQDYGLAVDESTQKLLNEAQAAGSVGEAHRSAQDQMAASMERLAGIFELVAQKLGVTKAELQALDGTSVNVNVNTNYTSSGSNEPPSGGGEPFHGHDNFTEYAEGTQGLIKFSPHGTPALLHNEEAVMTKGQLSNLVSLASGAGYASAARASWASPGNMTGGPSNADVVAELSQVRGLLATFPQAVSRSTRDAIQLANMGRR